MPLKTYIAHLDLSAITVLGLAILCGYWAGRLARWAKLPGIIGYLFLGVLVGPSVTGIFSHHNQGALDFLTRIGLGFVAVTIGTELSLATLRRLGWGLVAIIFSESLGAFVAVLVGVYLLTGDAVTAIIFGALAPATAPAGTVAVIQEYRARGDLTRALYAVVGFDDGVAIVIFGFAIAVAEALLFGGAAGVWVGLLRSVEVIGLSLLLGGLIGWLFSGVARRTQRSTDLFIVLFGTVFLTTGLAVRWNLSFILANMMVGFVLTNTQREAVVENVRAQLTGFMPLVYLIFFTLAGAHLDVAALPALGWLGLVYIVARTAGKLIGASAAAAASGAEPKVRRYLGLGLLSQAGVALGLALAIQGTFARLAAERNLPDLAVLGASVLTTITATSIFFELLGPVLTKLALKRAGEIREEPGRGTS